MLIDGDTAEVQAIRCTLLGEHRGLYSMGMNRRAKRRALRKLFRWHGLGRAAVSGYEWWLIMGRDEDKIAEAVMLMNLAAEQALVGAQGDYRVGLAGMRRSGEPIFKLHRVQ